MTECKPAATNEYDLPTSEDLVPKEGNPWFCFRPDPEPGTRIYNDAQLYRLIVAKALREGRAPSKAAFDAEVRRLGTIEEADEVIAFNKRRPGCKAWLYGRRMVCDCGRSWLVSEPDPPKCNAADMT